MKVYRHRLLEEALNLFSVRVSVPETCAENLCGKRFGIGNRLRDSNRILLSPISKFWIAVTTLQKQHDTKTTFMKSTPEQQVEIPAEQEFLIDAAVMLHQYGTPAYRLERVMGRVAGVLNTAADFLYTPTSLLIAFQSGKHRTRLKRIEPASPQLGKLIEFDNVLDRLEVGTITLEDAHRQIKKIDDAPSRYGFSMLALACWLTSACVTILLGGGLAEAIYASAAGALIVAWDRVLEIWFPHENLIEITSGFLAALGTIVVGRYVPGFDQSTALLGALIALVPGFQFTVAVAELANRHLSCGVARLAGSLVSFLGLVLGVTLAWRLFEFWRTVPDVAPADGLPFFVFVSAVVLAPFSLAIIFQARVKEWPVIVLVTWCGAVATSLVTQFQGTESGAFAGALAVGVVSNLYARLFDRPASVAQMPAILLLVPGSLGYKSLTAFVEHNQTEGIEIGFNMSIIAIAIVGGLLTANLIVPPRRIL